MIIKLIKHSCLSLYIPSGWYAVYECGLCFNIGIPENKIETENEK